VAPSRPRDERICWLAVRDELTKRSSNRFLVWWLALMGGTANRRRHKATRRRLEEYSFAVHDAAGKLSPDERDVLRKTGKVPDWFLDEVERLRLKARG
jgi:hypothetical protein